MGKEWNRIAFLEMTYFCFKYIKSHFVVVVVILFDNFLSSHKSHCMHLNEQRMSSFCLTNIFHFGVVVVVFFVVHWNRKWAFQNWWKMECFWVLEFRILDQGIWAHVFIITCKKKSFFFLFLNRKITRLWK